MCQFSARARRLSTRGDGDPRAQRHPVDVEHLLTRDAIVAARRRGPNGCTASRPETLRANLRATPIQFGGYSGQGRRRKSRIPEGITRLTRGGHGWKTAAGFRNQQVDGSSPFAGSKNKRESVVLVLRDLGEPVAVQQASNKPPQIAVCGLSASVLSHPGNGDLIAVRRRAKRLVVAIVLRTGRLRRAHIAQCICVQGLAQGAAPCVGSRRCANNRGDSSELVGSHYCVELGSEQRSCCHVNCEPHAVGVTPRGVLVGS